MPAYSIIPRVPSVSRVYSFGMSTTSLERLILSHANNPDDGQLEVFSVRTCHSVAEFRHRRNRTPSKYPVHSALDPTLVANVVDLLSSDKECVREIRHKIRITGQVHRFGRIMWGTWLDTESASSLFVQHTVSRTRDQSSPFVAWSIRPTHFRNHTAPRKDSCAPTK